MTNPRREDLWTMGTRATRVGLGLLLVAAVACSSKSSGSASDDESQNDAGGDDVALVDAQSAGDSSLGGHDANGGDAAHPSMDATAGDAAADASHADAGGSSSDAGHSSTDAAGSVDAGDSPALQTGATATYCAAVCGREAACLDAGPDAGCTCNPGELELYRSDYVVNLAACESSATCDELLVADAGSPDAGLQACANAVLAQVTPTAAVTSFCAQVGDSTCVDDAITDCPDTIKVYSDVTVTALAACISDPTCADHQACVNTALTPPQ